MRTLGIVGSQRKDGKTDQLVRAVLDGVGPTMTETQVDILYAADLPVQPCRVLCSSHCTTHPYHCAVQDDTRPALERMAEANVFVMGEPRHFRGPRAGDLANALVEAMKGRRG